MALIKCEECGKEISSLATSCPSCGKPINGNVVTTQQTSKHWKLIKFISWIVFLIGLSNAFAGQTAAAKSAGIAFAVLAFVGILVAKFGSWWTNK